MFGHRPAFGYGHLPNEGYFELKLGSVDGIGRQHAHLHCECERCGENYKVGNLHIPHQYVEALNEKRARPL